MRKTTLTEKVDDSKSGWEMWVADESLMTTDYDQNNLTHPQNHSSNTSNTINFNHSYNTSNPAKYFQPTSHSQMDIPQQHAIRRSQEGSLTGIGSLSKYKPTNQKPLPSPSSSQEQQQQQPSHPPEDPRQSLVPLASPPPVLSQPSRQTSSEIPSIHQPRIPLTSGHITHPQSSSHKPDLPHSPPSTNTLGLVSPHRSEPRKNPPASSSKGPGIPYAHAYELYGRHVTRVQPPPAHAQSQAGPYPNITSPPQEINKQLAPVAEVCLECTMRDRDMAGVDVLSPGVWARASDADFEQAMLDEAAAPEENSHHRSEHCLSIHRATANSTADGSNHDTQSNHKTSRAHLDPQFSPKPIPPSLSRPTKKRLGKGQPLTMLALKTWTQMNPPATAHRWRTLQLYLREQRYYLELERQATRSVDLETERTEELIRTNADGYMHPNLLRTSTDQPSPNNYHRCPPSRAKVDYRASSATLFTKGMNLETLDVSKDEKEAVKHRVHASSRRVSTSSPALRNRNSRSPRSGLMNINSLSLSTELLNQSDHLPLNSATSQPISPGRAPSPTRFSFVSRKNNGFGESMRPFSGWARARRSGSNSVLSLAPSGSLLDMHVGLSHDRHNLGPCSSPHASMSKNRSMLNFRHHGGLPVESQYTHKPSLASLTSSPTTSRFNGEGDATGGNQKKEKKKLRHTLKGLWSKLGISRQRPCSIDQIGAPTPLGIIPPRTRGHARTSPEDDPFVPPPSLSALAREHQNHRRTRSTLSLPLTSVCRFGPFRPQSVSTQHPGFESTASSPMSQNFIPPSPGSKLTFNGTGTTGHLSTTYMNSAHDPQFDSLAEELEMLPSQRGSLPASRLKNRVRSLGTMSFLSGVSVNEETNNRSPPKTRSPDGREPVGGGRPRESIDETEEPVGCSDPDGSHAGGSRVVMMNNNGADPAGPPSTIWTPSSSTSTPDKPSSVLTLMSRSSKMLSKFPGLKSRRASSGGSLVLQPNPHNNPTTITAAPTTTNGKTDNLRSSSSTQFPTPTPLEPMSHDPNPDSGFQNTPLDLNGQGYLPLEKSRHPVSRSSDFLALRYISLGRDKPIDKI